MAIALGAQAVNSSPGSSQTTHTASITLSAGDLVVCCVTLRDNRTITSVTGTVNATYTQIGTEVSNSNDGSKSALFYFENSAAGSETVTLTLDTAGRAGLNVSRWTGAATSGALDQNDGAAITSTGTSHNSGSITTTGAGLIAVAAYTGGTTGGTTFTDFTALTSPDGARYNPFYRIVTGSTAETGDYSTVNSVISTNKMASFNEAAAAGGTPPSSRLMLLNVG